MEFKVEKRESVTDASILSEIQRVMELLGKSTLTIKDFDTYGKFNSTTVMRHLGSWNDALYKIGLKSGNTFHSYEALMDNLRDAWLKKGKQPTRRDMDDKSLSCISSGAYLRKFGTWYNALDNFVKYITDSESETSDFRSIVKDQNTIKHKTKREPSNRLKVQVLMRDGNRCRICGIECRGGLHNIHFDHITPWSKGGETTLDNLQVLCSSCNEAKGNM